MNLLPFHSPKQRSNLRIMQTWIYAVEDPDLELRGEGAVFFFSFFYPKQEGGGWRKGDSRLSGSLP